MTPGQQPVVIGTCTHCGQPLYDAGPVAADGPLAHVACAVDARRR